MDTLELTVDLTPKDPWSDIVVAQLSELGFDSFVMTDSGFMAYANATVDIDSVIAQTVLSQSDEISAQLDWKIIPHQNWNATWEANFSPVFIEDYATIMAPFHEKSEAKGMFVEIQPQMSFGTGHHQTTWMMVKALFEMETMPANVLDMGSGTGVLAIIAEKLGAKRVLAIDIEDWSTENAIENTARNECSIIECVCGDIDKLGDEQFGLIVANINKNVLKSHMQSYANALLPGGTLLLSGFFSSDVDELIGFASEFGLKRVKIFERDEWAGIQLENN